MPKVVTYSFRKIVQAREDKGWSVQELAEKLTKHLGREIRSSQVRGWEGGIKPSPDYLIAMAQVFGKKVEYFYGETENV